MALLFPSTPGSRGIERECWEAQEKPGGKQGVLSAVSVARKGVKGLVVFRHLGPPPPFSARAATAGEVLPHSPRALPRGPGARCAFLPKNRFTPSVNQQQSYFHFYIGRPRASSKPFSHWIEYTNLFSCKRFLQLSILITELLFDIQEMTECNTLVICLRHISPLNCICSAHMINIWMIS